MTSSEGIPGPSAAKAVGAGLTLLLALMVGFLAGCDAKPSTEASSLTSGSGSGGASSKVPTLVYVSVPGSNLLRGYRITNPATGALTLTDSLAIAANPGGIAADPAGKYLYVASDGANDVYGYTISSSSTPTLTAMSPSPTFATGTFPFSVVMDPLGRYLYTPDVSSNDIHAFTIAANGALNTVGVPASAASGPQGGAIDPAGKYVYFGNAFTSLYQFNINADGSLPSTPTATYTTSGSGVSFMAVDSTGKYLYATYGSSSVIQGYSIGPAGALTPITGMNPFSVSSPQGVVAHPSAPYLYVATGGTSITQYTINGSGLLTSPVSVSAGSSTAGLAIDPAATLLYAASNGAGQVWIYTVNPATGALSVPSSQGVGTGPRGVWVVAY